MRRAINLLNPFDYVSLAFEQHKLMLATAETVWRRSSMMAQGSLSMSESMAMWVEKPTAMMKGFEKASLAAVAGKAPVQVLRAGMAPVTAKASSNAKRLRR